MREKAQPWIFSPRFDIGFILAPAIIITTLIVIFRNSLVSLKDVPPWLWLLLIVGIDVSHVYSSLFRTYLDRDELRQRGALYTLTPLLAWVIGCLLYSAGSLVFWRALAYLAVLHFIRQQYGFMMIYSRKERNVPGFFKAIDKAAIYLATIYPLIYWHSHTREFDWFVQGDFVAIDLPAFSFYTGIIYLAVLIAYVLKEVVLWRKNTFNIPRNLLLFGTAFSWFVGIVAFDNDLAFTATNVIAHGIPYIALIWGYGRNQTALQYVDKASYVLPWISKLFNWRMLPLFVSALFLFAFIEEGFWDGFVWREHGRLFRFSNLLPAIGTEQTLVWLVPLLALPQTTHYILDAFIWRLRADDTRWKQILFYQTLGKA